MSSIQPRRVLLFGGAGQIGHALQACAEASGRGLYEIRAIPWSRVACAAPAVLGAELDRSTEAWREFDVVFANGITNAGESAAELNRSNVAFPLAVIEALRHREGTRFITLGTVLEDFPELASRNEYVKSKLEIGRRLLGRQALAEADRILHLRLHTVYGGHPKSHMFLGQMVEALRQGSEFRMSAGTQLREYHHVNDIAGAVLALLLREWRFGGEPLTLSSGDPIRLADLAKVIFAGCGRPELLKIGAVSSPPGENCNRTYPRSPSSLLPYYREPLLGVLQYVRSCLCTGAGGY